MGSVLELVDAYEFSANLHDATQKEGNIIFLQLLVETLDDSAMQPNIHLAYNAMLAADDYILWCHLAIAFSLDLVPAIQKSRLRLLGRALDPGVENVYTWLRGGVLNGEADLDQRWLDGTVEHESMGTRHDNQALIAPG
ncbi:hypothetical protein BASA83_013006 [Batrachochytrium salamandrivorans]|nr:hypothetical protein BASA83_013006 [Batrachochytrium salamandrivorans]